MIEIIPNYHPIFVHFTVALFSTAVGFYVLSFITARLKVCRLTTVQEFETVSRWCLWLVALLSLITVITGLHAYNTVKHDTPSHLAMTVHRNWAIPTAIAMVLMALWSLKRYRKRQALTVTFIIALLAVQGLLLTTAWHGAELVFRYGLGVMSLPQTEEHQNNHAGEPHNIPSRDILTTPAKHEDGHSHAHNEYTQHTLVENNHDH